jgi:hypothetical protein
LLANLRQGWKKLTVTNVLGYFTVVLTTEVITVLESILVFGRHDK